MNKKVREYIIKYRIIGFMLFIGIVFFFVIGDTNVYLGKDSRYYLDFQRSKALTPIYSHFIYICKSIFSESIYLECVTFIQGIFGMLSCMYLVLYLRKEFALAEWETVLVYLLSFGPYAISLPEYVYSHSIMTESISFSVFYLWFVALITGILHCNLRSIFMSFVYGVVLALIRLQLGFLLGFCVIALVVVVYKKYRQKISSAVLKRIGIYICILGAIAIFGLYKIGTFNTLKFHVANLSYGKVMYVADEEDVEVLEDDVTKVIFKEAIQEMDKQKLRFQYARKDLWQWQDLKNNNAITLLGTEIMREHMEGTDITGQREKLVIPLLKDNWVKYLQVIFLLFPESLMCAIFIQKESFYLLCYIITFLLYFSSIGVCIWSWIKKKEDKKSTALLSIVLLILTSNIFFTNFILYGLQRYLAYTFGLFYIGYFLTIRNMFKDKIRIYKK